MQNFYRLDALPVAKPTVKALKELCKHAARLDTMHQLGSQESGISGYSASEIRNTGSSCFTLEKIK